jgi:hypothetical protein
LRSVLEYPNSPLDGKLEGKDMGLSPGPMVPVFFLASHLLPDLGLEQGLPRVGILGLQVLSSPHSVLPPRVIATSLVDMLASPGDTVVILTGLSAW